MAHVVTSRQVFNLDRYDLSSSKETLIGDLAGFNFWRSDNQIKTDFNGIIMVTAQVTINNNAALPVKGICELYIDAQDTASGDHRCGVHGIRSHQALKNPL